MWILVLGGIYNEKNVCVKVISNYFCDYYIIGWLSKNFDLFRSIYKEVFIFCRFLFIYVDNFVEFGCK